FYTTVAHTRRVLHSFPTRRSSDLLVRSCKRACPETVKHLLAGCQREATGLRWNEEVPGGSALEGLHPVLRVFPWRQRRGPRGQRSEEHTSELQSLTNLLCPLLLQK